MKIATLALALLLACVLGAIPASADTIIYTVNVGNAILSGFTGPYAQVTVDRTDSTHATITFDSLTNGGNIYIMAGADAAGVNVNATTWSISAITGTAIGITGFSPGPFAGDGSNNVSSFGVFNQTVKGHGGFPNSATEISFILANLSGTWADAASVLAANSDGHFVEIHGFVCAIPCDAHNGAINTGFATDGGVPVPEPGSLVLLGSGLIGLGGVARRKLRT